jgi:L,D-peptidoglycan transpeptidase YkuD (ErfK/YbiS/YcfS/YnhG family)
MIATRRTLIAAASAAAGLALAETGWADPDADVIFVAAKPGETHGTLRFAGQTYPCMVGRMGVTAEKYEGDGCTPVGRFHLREVRYRPDVFAAAPATRLPCFAARQSDGWCDDPSDPNYNRLVTLPYANDCEQMWHTTDHLYDLLAVIGYNDSPVQVGRGSAIFLHVMRPAADGHQWTAGCVSLELPNLKAVLAACTPRTQIDIRAV